MADGRSIYWRDNQHLLFLGHDEIKPISDHPAKLALILWKIGEEAAVLRRDVDTLCYRPGQIMYVVRDRPAKKRVFYQGEIGYEKAVELTPNTRTDLLNCNATYQPPDKSLNRSVRPLLHGHGYLYLGPGSGPGSMENTPVSLSPDGRAAGKQLPFGRREYNPPQYYEFRGAYLIHLSYFDPVRKYATTTWPKNESQKAYWLWPDGRTEKIEIPNDLAGAYPSKAGFVYRIFGTGTPRDGLYLFTPGLERKRVVQGYVTENTISPDGCKVAFAYAPDVKTYLWRPNNKRTLKIANLCIGSEK